MDIKLQLVQVSELTRDEPRRVPGKRGEVDGGPRSCLPCVLAVARKIQQNGVFHVWPACVLGPPRSDESGTRITKRKSSLPHKMPFRTFTSNCGIPSNSLTDFVLSVLAINLEMLLRNVENWTQDNAAACYVYSKRAIFI